MSSNTNAVIRTNFNTLNIGELFTTEDLNVL